MKSSFLAEGSAIHSGTFSRPQGDVLVPYRKIRSFPAFAGVTPAGIQTALLRALRLRRWVPARGSPRRRHLGAPRDERKIVFVTAQPRPPAERIARVA